MTHETVEPDDLEARTEKVEKASRQGTVAIIAAIVGGAILVVTLACAGVAVRRSSGSS